MKLIISEISSGFSDYSYKLCNALCKNKEIGRITYLTDSDNDYKEKLNPEIIYVQLYDTFSKKLRKNSILWIINRVSLPFKNNVRRYRYVNRNNSDCIIIQLSIPVIEQFFLKQLQKKIKVVLTVHDVIQPTRSMSWSIKSLRKIYDTADTLVVHSEVNKKQLMDIFDTDERKIKVIPFGIENKSKLPDKVKCREELGIGQEEKVLLFYGSIRESKGLDILLNAMKGLGYKLLIAGSLFYGEKFDRYDDLIEKNGINCNKYIYYTTDEFADKLFAACDYVVLPYKEFYSQSGVFIQAISNHRPLIVTDVAAFREIVEKYHIGYWCKANNVEALKNVLKSAYDKDTSEFEENMIAAIRENSWEKTQNMYFEIADKMQ